MTGNGDTCLRLTGRSWKTSLKGNRKSEPFLPVIARETVIPAFSAVTAEAASPVSSEPSAVIAVLVPAVTAPEPSAAARRPWRI